MTVNQTTNPHEEALKRLRSTHPQYDAFKPLWDFYLAAYEGGPTFARKENLHQHTREHDEDFGKRAERVHYMNYPRPLVDFFTDYIFKETIHRDGGKYADYAEFCENVNLKRENIETFMRHISQEFQIFGTEYIIVDAPPVESDRKLSKAEQKKLGIRPYMIRVRPHEILDWVKDEFDRYIYVKRVQHLVQMVGRKKVPVERYTEWTLSEITITDVDLSDAKKPVVQEARVIPNAIGRVPVVPVIFAESLEYPDLGLSFLRDIAPLAKEVMNLTSLLQEFLYRQCFNFLAIEDDANMSEQEQHDGDLGTSNLMKYPKGSSAPTYVSPPVEPAEFLQSERTRLIEEMYRLAAENVVSEIQNGGKASGMSKAMGFSTTVPKIATRADILERAENDAMELVMLFQGKDWDGAIKYKDHYEITNLNDQLTQLTTLFRDLAFPSKEAAKEELKRIYREVNGKASAEKLAKVDAEIEKYLNDNFDEWLDKVIGKGKPSPAEQNAPKQTGTMQEMMAESNKEKLPEAANKTRKARNRQ